jgi:hypothetical protein
MIVGRPGLGGTVTNYSHHPSCFVGLHTGVRSIAASFVVQTARIIDVLVYYIEIVWTYDSIGVLNLNW